MVADKNLIKQTLAAAGDDEIKEADIKFALKYLEYYYIDPNAPVKLNTKADVSNLVKKFQKMFHLTANGKLDAKTIRAMATTPRCGCRDYPMAATSGPMKVKWGTNRLTYFIDSYVKGLSKSDQDDLNALAFQQWADVADLQFERIRDRNKANMILSTGRGRSQGFDGPNGTLAWAYLPSGNNYQGQLLMRYDLDETWIKDATDRGILFLNVACHEFGHLLGLDHSNKRGALMAPYYTAAVTKPQQNDDVTRIQRLYGPPGVVPPPPPSPPPAPPVPPPPPTGGGVTIEINNAKLSDITINGKPFSDFSLI
jgi:hypothetical protein